jgi:hypothetical protein
LELTAWVVYLIEGGQGKEPGLARLEGAIRLGLTTGLARENLLRLHEVYKAINFLSLEALPSVPKTQKK